MFFSVLLYQMQLRAKTKRVHTSQACMSEFGFFFHFNWSIAVHRHINFLKCWNLTFKWNSNNNVTLTWILPEAKITLLEGFDEDSSHFIKLESYRVLLTWVPVLTSPNVLQPPSLPSAVEGSLVIWLQVIFLQNLTH